MAQIIPGVPPPALTPPQIETLGKIVNAVREVVRLRTELVDQAMEAHKKILIEAAKTIAADVTVYTQNEFVVGQIDKVLEESVGTLERELGIGDEQQG